MNHLAHALLAAPDEDLVLGGLIGDFVRGAPDAALPAGVRSGIVLHRAIDGYTDSHAAVAAARALFEPPYRRFAGILLDVWFDHLLARDWARRGSGDLDAFSRDVRALLDRRHAVVPPRMRGFVAYMRENDLPAAYGERAMIGKVLGGISRRLARENPLATALPVLEALAAPLARTFDAFFPDLRAFAAAGRARLGAP